MTTFGIDGPRVIRVEGDDIATRSDGSLWVLRATTDAKALVPVLILARGQWSSVVVDGAAVQVIAERPANREPRFA